ncbi:MAG TPA: DinB family protein [Terriglobales bacterium]|nr:DinB family protein [Terriglobales bacterium]
MAESFPEIASLCHQLDAAERDSRLLVADFSEERGCWRAAAGSWSVAQCLDHLAITNEVYLGAMKEQAIQARAAGRLRRRPALPGFIGRWFATRMEPPVKTFSKMKSTRNIKPGASPSLADAFGDFLKSQDKIRDYLSTNADLDLAGIRFPNPLIPGIRFSLATGLHVLTAHERRHLWQAWRVRRAAGGAAGDDVRLAL